jgi:hypothetical protein
MSRKTKSSRSNFFSRLFNNAVLPLGISGVRKTYKNKSYKSYKYKQTRKHKRCKKSRRHY